jgi:hypothetical protein
MHKLWDLLPHIGVICQVCKEVVRGRLSKTVFYSFREVFSLEGNVYYFCGVYLVSQNELFESDLAYGVSLNANYFMTKRWDAKPNGKFLENFIFDRIQLKYLKKPKKQGHSKALLTTITFALKYTWLNRK